MAKKRTRTELDEYNVHIGPVLYRAEDERMKGGCYGCTFEYDECDFLTERQDCRSLNLIYVKTDPLHADLLKAKEIADDNTEDTLDT